MRLTDFYRAQNRALINQVANGAPPYTSEEVTQNRINTNVNFLDLTNITHSARRQFANAFMNVDPAFTVAVDYGTRWKQHEYGQIITEELAKVLRKSHSWFEMRRSVFANVVLHGIGPAIWNNRNSWCPEAIGVEDILVPGDTLLDMKNLPFFAVYRQYTAMQLWQMVDTAKPDPGWNVPQVKRAIAWCDQQARQLIGNSWPSMWSPEKWEERIKSDGALYASDAVPTIGTYDLYFWSEDKNRRGWRRRMVIDAWGNPGPGIGSDGGIPVPSKNMIGERGEFLYTSGDRVFCEKRESIVHFQFADCSAVAPFRYHTVRSLGFLLYSICHLQNRLRSRFSDAVFESLMQFFRTGNVNDAERLVQLSLIDKGVIPEGIDFVKAEERWKVDLPLAETALNINRQTMADNSVSFTQDYDFGNDQQSRNETATRTQAKVTATAALVGAMLSQAYKYEEFRYHEMARRFCRKNSGDSEVRKFRVSCLLRGVPEEALDADCWNMSSEKIIGAGDKQLANATADSLMAIRQFLDGPAQKKVDRIYIATKTDDYSLARELVPDVRGPTKSQELASLAMGTLMQGMPVVIEDGIDLVGYIDTMLNSLHQRIQANEQKGGMASMEEIIGYYNTANHLAQQISKLAQDPAEKPRVKMFGDALGQMMNMVKAYQQRLQEQMQQAQQNGQGNGQDPKDAAKAQAMIQQAQIKSQLTQESHAQRTAQRKIQFEQQMQQDAERHAAEMRKMNLEADLKLQQQAKEVEVAAYEHRADQSMAALEHQQALEQSAAQHRHDLAARELEAQHAIKIQQAQADAAAESETGKE